MFHSGRLIIRTSIAFFILFSLILGISPAVFAAAQPDAAQLVVSPAIMNGWFPFQDKSTPGFTSLVSGPAVPPAGQGSARLRVTADSQAPVFGTPQFMNVRLADLTTLAYSTYVQPGSGAAQAPALFLEVDYEDPANHLPYEGRLTYEPYMNGTVTQGAWQEWDALSGQTAKWWSSRAPFNATCPQSAPCTLAAILTKWPDVRITNMLGIKAGSGWANFDGNFDRLAVGFPGINKTFDFEPPAVTYVDDDWASVVPSADPDGAGPAIAYGLDAFSKIQDAIDAVAPGGMVNVYPGSYGETAPGKTLFDGSGPYQFGLFVGSAKPGISVRGLDAAGAPILDQHNVLASITTHATNSFGYSGIFVEADGVSFSGLKILQNLPSDNKTIEVIGDNFTLLASVIDVPGGGSVYLNDWRFLGGVSYLKSYHIEGNRFAQAASLDIASGAGYSGPDSGRVVKNNVFEYDPSASWPAISFSGTVPSVAWFVNPVSGAQITGNTFSGGVQYIRARGVYNEPSFDWTAYWNNNTFDRAVIAGVDPLVALREFSYTGAYGPIEHVRRIGALIQGEIDIAQPGDTILVKAGTYPESPNLNQSVTLKSESGRDLTTIALQPGPTYLGSLTISGADVTVDGFTITGFDATPTALASSNIFLTTTPRKVSILNNRLKVGNIGANTNGDDGFGLITSYAVNADPAKDVAELLVQGNLFEPLNAAGWRAYYINPGVDKFTFRQNSITGTFGGRATAQARNGLVEENTLTGSGASGGFATWGYPTPSIYGKTTFRSNVISGTQKAISITSTENVTVTNNDLHDNAVGIWLGNSASMPLAFNPATNQIHQNSITASATAGLVNEETGSVSATQNWWGSARGPRAAGNPLGDGGEISGAAQYDPWLCDGTDTNPSLIGFQPGTVQCTNQPVRLVFTTQPSNGIAGIALPTQPVVRVEGANGELAINFEDNITLLLANNPGGAVLSGLISLNAVDGVASFSGLSLDKPANGYALLAWASVGVKASAAFNILPYEANLSVSHTAVPAVVAPNATWSIILGVANSGPADATELSLTDSLPAGVNFVSAAGASWNCSQAAGVVHCTLPLLASGGSSSVTLTLKALAVPGKLTNQAAVTSAVPDPSAANNATSATITVAAVPVTGLTYYLPAVSH